MKTTHTKIVKAKNEIEEIFLLCAQIPVFDESKWLTHTQIGEMKMLGSLQGRVFIFLLKKSKKREGKKNDYYMSSLNSYISSTEEYFNPMATNPWIHSNTYVLPAYSYRRSQGAEGHPSISG